MSQNLKFKVKYKARRRVIYDALTFPVMILKYTQSQTIFDNKVGGEFSFYENYIMGINQELIPNTKIVQKWKLNNWNDYADLTISFKDISKTECHLTLHMINIPERDKLNVKIEVKQIENEIRSLIFQKIHDSLGYQLNNDSGYESDSD